MPPCAQQRLLDHVFGPLPITVEQVRHEPEQGRRMLGVQLAHDLFVSRGTRETLPTAHT
jgi:hypothetical protein